MFEMPKIGFLGLNSYGDPKDIFIKTITPEELDKHFAPSLPDGCNHSWKKYVGLTQTFEYCEMCDAKKLQ